MGKIITWVVVGLTVLGLAWYGIHIWRRETADTKGTTDVIEAVSGDAGYRLAEYEQFYDRCWAIIELEAQIAIAQESLAAAEPGSWDASALQRNLTALQNQRIDLIAAYNADAAKADTAQNFLADGLPPAIELEGETSCTAPAE